MFTCEMFPLELLGNKLSSYIQSHIQNIPSFYDTVS